MADDGPSTNAHNQPVEDPTDNVRELFEAGGKRQDDLRTAQDVRTADRFEHIREIMTLERGHAQELREKEAARIDSIRSVDVGAVARAAEVAATQANTLATQLVATAEAARTALAATATTTATALAQALDPILSRLAALDRNLYEQQGVRASVNDARAGTANIGMWIGIATSTFVALIATGVTTWLASKP